MELPPKPEERLNETRHEPEHLVSEKMKLQIMTDALRILSCLGSGDSLGNSKGNIIAQRALVRCGIGFNDPRPVVDEHG